MLYKFNKASNNFGDISIINPNNLPDFDYFTYSFPCTDISISGKQQGIEKGKTRSGLLYECEKIIETKKPKYLLMENVKNLVSKKFRPEFDKWCEYLETLGYTNYHNNYKCLNAKDFGIAQNRERIFMISILGEHTPYEFPMGIPLNKRLKDFLEDEVDDKYYLSDEIQKRFKHTKEDNGINNIIGTTAPITRTIGQRDIVYSCNSPIIGSLVATDYKQPKQILERVGSNDIIVLGNTNQSNHNATRVLSTEGISCTVMENHGKVVQILEEVRLGNNNTKVEIIEEDIVKEIFNYKPSGENVIGTLSSILWEKRNEQTRRVYHTESIAPTIPTCQGSGTHPKILVQTDYKQPKQIKIEKLGELDLKGYLDIEKRVYSTNGLASTLDTRCRTKYVDDTINFKIRKLTPKECLRLMGLSDTDIEKMQSINLSDSSLYKLAGNSIVKNVLDEIHINLFQRKD
jgi:DNA (cytosine-5)-methyltransferase 1